MGLREAFPVPSAVLGSFEGFDDLFALVIAQIDLVRVEAAFLKVWELGRFDGGFILGF